MYYNGIISIGYITFVIIRPKIFSTVICTGRSGWADLPFSQQQIPKGTVN